MIDDEVYLQESPTLIKTATPLTGVAAHNGIAYVGGSEGLWSVNGNVLSKVKGFSGSVQQLVTLDGLLWVITSDGLWNSNGKVLKHITSEAVADLCEHNGTIVVASGNALYRVENDTLVPLCPPGRANILGVASYSGTLYIHDGKHVALLEKDHIE